MEFSSSQLTALQNAQSILDDAGLSPCDLNNHSVTSSPSPSQLSCSEVSPASLVLPLPLSAPVPCPIIISARYIPPPARSFTLDEITTGANRINRQSRVGSIISHPPGAVVEYPQTGATLGDAVAHIFTLVCDANTTTFDFPQFSFQYSLGDSHGGTKGVQCYLLRDSMGKPVCCKKLSTSCKSLCPRGVFLSAHAADNSFQVKDLKFVLHDRTTFSMLFTPIRIAHTLQSLLHPHTIR
jgi:hypothetical protein